MLNSLFTYVSNLPVPNVSVSIALASMLISVFTFTFTMHQFAAIRKHNRIAVRPYLTTFCKKQFDLENNVATIEWTLSNEGLGPAIISSYQLCLDGNPVDTNKRDERDVLLLFSQVFGPRLRRPIDFVGLSEGGIIAKEKSKPIIVVELSTTPISNIKSTREISKFASGIERFELVVYYTSFYSDKFDPLRASGG